MNNFIYDIPTKVYFGANQLSHLGEELSRFGKRVLLVYGGGSIKKTGLYDQVVAEIAKATLMLFECAGIEPNPRVTSINRGAAICKKESIDVILAVGGGSVIDAAKVIGAARYYDGDAWDFMTHKGKIENVLPVVTVLTLAATGSEMDNSAVISNAETKEKLPCFHALMQPKVSFLDPTNTYSVNTYQTACGAADILSHVMEVYFNLENDLAMLDGVMEALMKTVLKYAPITMKEPENYEARANLMWASSWAINGFVSAGKQHAWSCHPIEHELSAFYDITHGLGLAILTPRWMEYTLDESTVAKFYQFGCNVFDLDRTMEPMAVAKESIRLFSAFLFETLGLSRSLTEIGIDDTHFAEMARKICQGEIVPAFKPLAEADIEAILRLCL